MQGDERKERTRPGVDWSMGLIADPPPRVRAPAVDRATAEVPGAAGTAETGRGRALDLLPALLPGILTLYLALQSGGFFPGATGLAAAEVLLALVLWLALARHPWAGLSIPLAVAAAALAALAAWTLASSQWSDSESRATFEYVRVLLYLLPLVFFGLLPYSSARIRIGIYGLAAAIAVVCVLGMLARTLPDIVLDPELLREERLGHPLSYWNGLGLLAAIGIVLCGHLASSARDPWLARVLGAAAIPLLTATLYFTFSRGATWVALAAVIVYVVVARPRAAVSGAIATVPTTLVALIAANPPGPLTGEDPFGPAAVAAGERIALTVALCVIAAAVLRAALLPIDSRLMRARLPDRMRRPVVAGAVAVSLAVALTGSAMLDVPEFVSAKYREFTSDAATPGSGSSRLFVASANGRREHWHVALDGYRRDSLRGSGAGTYALAWDRERQDTLEAKDAHSLYLELLGELGLPGLIAAGLAIMVVLGAFAARARGPDRALFAALLAAGLAWTVHAGIDWDWELPAVSVWLFAFGGAALATRTERVGPRRLGPLLRIAAIAGLLALAVTPVRVAVSDGHLSDSIAALERGDCTTAHQEAAAALSALAARPTPHYVRGFCDLRQGRYASAVTHMSRAVRRDPENWELRHGLAVARAAAGLDPRPEIRRAVALNPQQPLARETHRRLRGDDRDRWRRAGRAAPLTPPRQGDP